jgi:hypothetical protein
MEHSPPEIRLPERKSAKVSQYSSISPTIKGYRKRQFFKRDQEATSIYEILHPNVFHHVPYEVQRINPGVYNTENSHWALLLEELNMILSFVWKAKCSKDDNQKFHITGGSCFVHTNTKIRGAEEEAETPDPKELDTPTTQSSPVKLKPIGLDGPEPIGTTCLSVTDIQIVGDSPMKIYQLIFQATGFVSIWDVNMFYGIIEWNLLRISYILFLNILLHLILSNSLMKKQYVYL